MSVKTVLTFVFVQLIIAAIFTGSNAKDVFYDFEATAGCAAPDGVEVCFVLRINGQLPGPPIEAYIGDTLHVHIKNNIAASNGYQPITLHWHGLFQNGSQFQDGPQMVTQCPIAQGSSQDYVFKLTQAGTYWYHSHVSYQYTEGLFGALIIHNLPEVYAADYDDELTIILSDWSQLSGQVNINWFLSSASGGNEPIPFSGLINGHGKYPCADTTRPCDPRKQQPPVFNVQRGKRYRVRIINTSAMAVFFFSIDGHVLHVIEVDGVDTVKVSLNHIPIAPAQRYSAIVEMNGHSNEYRILAEMSFAMYNFVAPNINPKPGSLIKDITARLVYNNHRHSPKSSYSQSTNDTAQMMIRSADDFFPKEMELQPYNRILAPTHFDRQITLEVDGLVDHSGVNHLTFNNITYKVGNRPLLVQVIRNEHIPESANAFITGHLEVVQVVLNNHDAGPHPFHLHGHTFWVMGRGITGAGDYNPSSDTLHYNGVRRDTVVVNAQSWLVFRFVTDNPGVWFFHCHINWHLQSGLAATIIEAPEVTRREAEIPYVAERVCRELGVDIG